MLERVIDKLYNWRDNLRSYVKMMVESDKRIPQEKKASTSYALVKGVTREDMLGSVTTYWDGHLSDSELKSIDAFLSTPEGKKMAEILNGSKPLVTKATRAALGTRYEKATGLRSLPGKE